MWNIEREPLDGGRALRLVFGREGRPLDVREALELWGGDADFREAFLAELAGAPFEAFRWEMPPLVRGHARAFEHVLTEDPALARLAPEPQAFAEHFRADAEVVAFPNLGGDARLVVPCPRAAHAAYPHLAAFVRQAPARQQHALLERVALELERTLGERPVWTSTAGLGVGWVHVRLDARPKYYVHAPYRREA